jgi:predicted Zn finger-like uncharacterized protein
MLIVCPACMTSYQVESSAIGDGREVRCARCQTTWFASSEPLATASLAVHEDAVGEAAEAAAAEWAAEEPEEVQAGWEEDSSRPPEQAPVVDGTTETEAPSLVPSLDGVEPPDAIGVGEDIDSFAARRARRLESMRRRRWQPDLAAIILTLSVINAGIIGWRADIVRLLPQTASLFAAIGLPVNLRGLGFANVTTAKETQEEVTVMVVEGTIANTTAAPVEVPRLRLAVRNEAGGEIYTWTALPDRAVLGAGETLPFRSRLASPPADGRDVVVRFFNRHDITSTGR